MKKNELKNGDIVVLENGALGVMIRNEDQAYLMFQNGGRELLEYYDDDMSCQWYHGEAVMRVYRSRSRGIDFEDFESHALIFEHEDCRNTMPARENKADLIEIISQAFYGNRTGVEIRKDRIDRFILGYQTDDVPISRPVDRTIVRVPHSDGIVLIYNRYQEEERRHDKQKAWEKDRYELKPLATIPEIGLEIYSRCIACRMNATGEFQSIRNEDFSILQQYLAK